MEMVYAMRYKIYNTVESQCIRDTLGKFLVEGSSLYVFVFIVSPYNNS